MKSRPSAPSREILNVFSSQVCSLTFNAFPSDAAWLRPNWSRNLPKWSVETLAWIRLIVLSRQNKLNKRIWIEPLGKARDRMLLEKNIIMCNA